MTYAVFQECRQRSLADILRVQKETEWVLHKCEQLLAKTASCTLHEVRVYGDRRVQRVVLMYDIWSRVMIQEYAFRPFMLLSDLEER